MKPILPSQVLAGRDRWAAETQGALAAGSKAVVRISARMPAALRGRWLADGLVERGAAAYQAECGRQGLSLRPLGDGRGALGPWRLWASGDDPLLLKRLALLIEEGSRQGQVLDLDVYSQDGPVSRSLLGMPPRRCVVCGGPAAVCAGRSIHPTSAVEAAFLDLLKGSSISFPIAFPRPSAKQFQFFPQDLRTDTPLAFNRP